MRADGLISEIRQYCRECASEELRMKYSESQSLPAFRREG